MNHTQFCYWLGGFFELTENVDNQTLTKIKQKHKELVDSGKHAEFCYWLQGFFELNATEFSDSRMLVIKDHLKVVFNKQTPERTLISWERDMSQIKQQKYQSPTEFYQTNLLPKIVC